MSENNRKTSFLESTGIVTVSHVGTIINGAVIGILTARYLGPEGKGQIALAMGAGIILAQILCLGFERAAPYYLASGKLSSEKVLGAWIITLLAGTLITFSVAYPVFVTYLIDNVFKGVSRSLLLISGLVCLLYMLRLLVNSILAGYEKFFKQTYHNITMFTCSITAAVLALIILGYGPLGYARVHITFGFISLVFGVFILRQVIAFKPCFNLRDWVKMFRYGSKAMLSQLLNLIDLRLDIYIINYFLSASIVGIYSVAAALGGVFWMLANSVSAVLFPRVSALDPEKSKQLTGLLCRNVMWLTIIFGGLFLLICRPVIIFLYGERFAGASVALALLMPGVVGQVVSRICFTDCSGRGFPGRSTIAAAITATMTIILDLILIPQYGMAGAAVASSIAYCSSGIMGLYWHIKLSGNSLGVLVIPKLGDLKYYRAALVKVKSKIIR